MARFERGIVSYSESISVLWPWVSSVGRHWKVPAHNGHGRLCVPYLALGARHRRPASAHLRQRIFKTGLYLLVLQAQPAEALRHYRFLYKDIPPVLHQDGPRGLRLLTARASRIRAPPDHSSKQCEMGDWRWSWTCRNDRSRVADLQATAVCTVLSKDR